MAELGGEIVLKLIAGPNAGAEIALAPGTHTIGRTLACDIVLSDDAVAERHVRVQVGDAGVEVRALDARVHVNGVPVPQDGQPLTVNDVVMVGVTQFCVGPSGSAWPKPGLPGMLPAAQAGRAPARESSSKPAPAVRPARAWQVFSSAVVGMLLVSGFFVFSQGNTKPVPLPTAKLEDQLQSAIHQLGLPNVDVITEDGGGLQVRGYVEHAAQRREVEDLLRRLKISAQQRLWVNDELVAAARQVLRALNMDQIEISAPAPGALAIKGYVVSRQAWARARALLTRDIPGIRSIDDQGLQTLHARVVALREIFARHDLQDKLTVQAAGAQLRVTGALSAEELPDWEAARREYTAAFGPRPAIRSEVRDTGKIIDLAIKGVSIGATAYVVAKDGRKYMEGAHLGHGYYIERIERGRILLRREGREFSHYLGAGEDAAYDPGD